MAKIAQLASRKRHPHVRHRIKSLLLPALVMRAALPSSPSPPAAADDEKFPPPPARHVPQLRLRPARLSKQMPRMRRSHRKEIGFKKFPSPPPANSPRAACAFASFAVNPLRAHQSSNS